MGRLQAGHDPTVLRAAPAQQACVEIRSAYWYKQVMHF